MATVTTALWHPVDKDKIMTAGLDGTVRCVVSLKICNSYKTVECQ